MASSKTPLQRRHGRRVSIPTSPTFFDRRVSDKAVRPELSTFTTHSTPMTGDSPSLDLHMPSPTFDVPGLSSPVFMNDVEESNMGPWDRQTVAGHKKSEDAFRSLSISSPVSDSGIPSSPQLSQMDNGFKSSPLLNRSRDTNEIGRFGDRRERFFDRPGVGTRNFSTTSLSTERSTSEDINSNRIPVVKKSRLNLLNPMSLLARRHSSQNSKLEDLNITAVHAPAIPDFDPSIRGKIVHDFSSPRIRTPRRDAFPNPAHDQSLDQGVQGPAGPSSSLLHSPVFKEHFQDDHQVLQPDQTNYLHNKQLDAPLPQDLPVFAQKLPTKLPSKETRDRLQASSIEIPHPEIPPPPPPKETPPPPPQKSPLLSVDDASISALPKHMKSTSSRFSFQISGQGSSAEEKILEDKHREPFSKHKLTVRDAEEAAEDDYDDYDFDAEDTFEEEIPSANIFDEGDNFGYVGGTLRNIEIPTSQNQAHPSNHSPVATFWPGDESLDNDTVTSNDGQDASSLNETGNARYDGIQLDWSRDDAVGRAYNVPLRNVGVSTSLLQHKSLDDLPGIAQIQPEPASNLTSHWNTFNTGTVTQKNRDPTLQAQDSASVGVARTEYSPDLPNRDLQPPADTTQKQPIFLEGLRISTTKDFEQEQALRNSADEFDDADLYFDDGEFDTENMEYDGNFDESMLDEGSTQIRDIPAENAKRYEAMLKRDKLGDEARTLNSGTTFAPRVSIDPRIDNLSDSWKSWQRSTGLNPTLPQHIQDGHSGLTENNLAAYHDALAEAANNAAVTGRFNRQVSFSDVSQRHEETPWNNSATGLLTDESRYSLNVGSAGIPDDEIYDIDHDDMDDELMIAEANAEALENDDDGIYGQEFGFYARAHGKDASDFVNGGYFTARGSNGVKRSHSGKANFQEPNLTPITERSEWSTRNSVASLPIHGGMPTSAQSLPSPGISQLLDSPLLEDEMSLSALMKLRRGAFGGSSTSINSLAERSLPNSSPLAHVTAHSFPSAQPSDVAAGWRLPTTQSTITNGLVGSFESQTNADSDSEYPTLTNNTPRKQAPSAAPHTPLEQITFPRLGVDMGSTARKGHHSRNSSGADSVSYTQDNVGQWILERRRTGDDGELEVIGREYLASARI